MAYHATVLLQLLQSVPRLEFERLATKLDGPRRSDALSCWSQFLALVVGHVGQRHSLRDIESALMNDPSLRYHLDTRSVSSGVFAYQSQGAPAMNRPLNSPARQTQEPAYLIINADDYAYFRGVSQGILECVREGTVTATGVFANSPLLDEHTAWLVAQPHVDVGVRLNLTDRAPLTKQLADALGKWNGLFPGKFPIAKAILSRELSIDLVRAEWRAQIEHCMARGLNPSFLNSHEHIHMLPPLYSITLALAREFGIEHVRFATPEWPPALSASALLRGGIMSVLAQINRCRMSHAAPIFLGMGESGRLSQPYLSKLLSKLRPGRVYELMCHPGISDPEAIKDMRLLSYHDWELERQTLCDPALKSALATHNVNLIGYRHLQPTMDGL